VWGRIRICRRNTVFHGSVTRTMNITTIGRGNIGGGLARLWERAGHSVTTVGCDGGDASDADIVLSPVRRQLCCSFGSRGRV
jgi:hypothetical protein